METRPFVAPLRDSLVGGWQNLGLDIIFYDIKKRNAARKTGSDVEKDLEWAEKELDKMHRGIIKFDDLPKKAIDSSSGSAASKMLYGNLKNPNFYI